MEAEHRLSKTPTLLKTPAGSVQPSLWLAISADIYVLEIGRSSGNSAFRGRFVEALSIA